MELTQMDERILAWIKRNIGNTLISRPESLPFRIKKVDEQRKQLKFVFLNRNDHTEKNALPLCFEMFERALTYLEINKERMVRLGAKVKPPYDLDTIEGQIWRQPHVYPTPFKASPHVCDIIVLSRLAEYGFVENPRTGRTVQGIRYTGLESKMASEKSLPDTSTRTPEAKLSNKVKIVLRYLESNPRRTYCDDCLSDLLDIRPRQQINQICNKRLKPPENILRQVNTCSVCEKIKLVNTVPLGQSLPLDAEVSPKEIIHQPLVASDNIEHSILNYYSKIQQDLHHRYRSWEHCYLFFQKRRPFSTADIKDLANLHLAFFLASWGMYRGNAFLLWKDYRIFDPIVDALIDPEYEILYHLDPAVLSQDSTVTSLVFQLAKNLSDIFTKTVHIVDGRSRNIEVTATLVTKILLGTMACTPAYDRYVIAGLGKHGFMHCRFSQASYRELLHFYLKNSTTFNRLRLPIPNSNLYYPPMKLVDMYFWSIGFENAGKLDDR
jgi:hypothetical protein